MYASPSNLDRILDGNTSNGAVDRSAVDETDVFSDEGMTRTWSRVSGCDLLIHLICHTLFKKSGVKNCSGVTVFEKETSQSRICNMGSYGLTIASMEDAKIFPQKAETLEL